MSLSLNSALKIKPQGVLYEGQMLDNPFLSLTYLAYEIISNLFKGIYTTIQNLKTELKLQTKKLDAGKRWYLPCFTKPPVLTAVKSRS